MRAILLFAGLAAAIVVALATFGVDEGEVVTLTTVDSAGARYDTQLWIVEADSATWLRAGSPHARWLARLRAHPAVEIRRGEQVLFYTAVPIDTPDERALVNRAMAEKYGRADHLIAHVFRREQSVPIRLDPREGEPPRAPRPYEH